jgi:hypothetical protein
MRVCVVNLPIVTVSDLQMNFKHVNLEKKTLRNPSLFRLIAM